MIQGFDEAGHIQQAQAEGIEKIVVGAVIYDGDKVLLMKRASSEKFFPDFVEPPGGGVEDGEDILSALAREVYEEAGLILTEVRAYLNSIDYISGSGRKMRQFNFHVQVESVAPVRLNPEEHSEHYWVCVGSSEYHALNISEKTKSVLAGVYKNVSA